MHCRQRITAEIGGGIGHEKENLLVPLRKMVERERYSIHAKVQTKIISAELGNDANLYGAVQEAMRLL